MIFFYSDPDLPTAFSLTNNEKRRVKIDRSRNSKERALLKGNAHFYHFEALHTSRCQYMTLGIHLFCECLTQDPCPSQNKDSDLTQVSLKARSTWTGPSNQQVAPHPVTMKGAARTEKNGQRKYVELEQTPHSPHQGTPSTENSSVI